MSEIEFNCDLDLGELVNDCLETEAKKSHNCASTLEKLLSNQLGENFCNEYEKFLLNFFGVAELKYIDVMFKRIGGRWDVNSNTITKLLDSCAMFENFIIGDNITFCYTACRHIDDEFLVVCWKDNDKTNINTMYPYCSIYCRKKTDLNAILADVLS